MLNNNHPIEGHLVQKAIFHAKKEYPKESVGFVVNGDYLPMTNIAADPVKRFRVEPEKFILYDGLIKAVNMMCCASTNQKRSANRMYGWLRESFAESMRVSQTGSKNSQYGKKWIHSFSEKKSKKVSEYEIDSWFAKGWILGRVVDFDKKEQRQKPCPICNKKFEGCLIEKISISVFSQLYSNPHDDMPLCRRDDQ